MLGCWPAATVSSELGCWAATGVALGSQHAQLHNAPLGGHHRSSGVSSHVPLEALHPVSETERVLSLQMALKCADLVSLAGVTQVGRVRDHLHDATPTHVRPQTPPRAGPPDQGTARAPALGARPGGGVLQAGACRSLWMRPSARSCTQGDANTSSLCPRVRAFRATWSAAKACPSPRCATAARRASPRARCAGVEVASCRGTASHVHAT